MGVYCGGPTKMRWYLVGEFGGWRADESFAFAGQPIPIVAVIHRRRTTAIIRAVDLADHSLAALDAIEPLPDGGLWAGVKGEAGGAGR